MEVVVGVFIVMVFFGLAYFTFVISGEQWGPEYEIEVVFNDVMGLRRKDSVVVRGMPIGEIRRLELHEDGVHVWAKVEEKLDMRKDYSIKIIRTSILGGRYVEIDEGSPQCGQLPLDTLFRGEDPHDFMAEATEVMTEIKEQFLGEDGVIQNFKAASVQLKEIATRLNAGKGTIGKLMSDDDTLYRDATNTVASIRQVAARLERGEGTLGKLFSKDDKLYADLSSAAESLSEVASHINKGEGAVGKLVKEDTLYKEVEAVVKELQAALDDFRETTPVTSFTSILFSVF
jgi:phospholipid/cholesterol/gamma-HCH transport system substrate-binding protein